MTVSQTERLQLYTWTQDTDAFTRIHMNESHENLEDRAARYVSSTTEPVPVANEWARSFWLDTDTDVVYFYTAEDENGTWKPLNLYGTAVQMSTTSGSIVGYLSGTLRQSNSAGTRDEFARIDHQHELPAPDLTSVAAKSTLTGKGSIYAATAASTPANLSVGSNNYVLVADSSTATGLKWDQVQNANLAGGITYDKLSLTQLSVAGNLSTTGSGSLTVAGGSTFTGAVTASSTVAITGNLTVDTNVLKVDTSNNRVGINKTSPSEALDVSGTVKATAFSGDLTGNVTGDVTGNVTGNVSGSSGSTTGNAATATKWQTARKITLQGDASGNVTFDGSANKDLTVTLASGFKEIYIQENSTGIPIDGSAIWIDTDG